MPEEPTTPDLVELVRKQAEAANRRDLDAFTNAFAEDATIDGQAVGGFLYESRAAINRFVEGWFDAFEELHVELEEVSHLGDGVVFAVVIQDGRPVGSVRSHSTTRGVGLHLRARLDHSRHDIPRR